MCTPQQIGYYIGFIKPLFVIYLEAVHKPRFKAWNAALKKGLVECDNAYFRSNTFYSFRTKRNVRRNNILALITGFLYPNEQVSGGECNYCLTRKMQKRRKEWSMWWSLPPIQTFNKFSVTATTAVNRTKR